MLFIEDTIYTVEQLERIQQAIIQSLNNRCVKQMRLKNINHRKVVIDIVGPNDNIILKIILTKFDNTLNSAIYDMFSTIERLTMLQIDV